jgi:predicted flap endonuclease-1-like 5' DNA nuclease
MAPERYKFYQQQIAQCDCEIAQALAQLPTRELKVETEPEKKTEPSAKRKKLTPLEAQPKRIAGVELTSIDGIGEQIAQILLS